jgi:CBS domain-containing protein
MSELTATELMEEFVTTLSAETSIDEAIEVLLKKKLTGAPVVDEENRLVGILSEKDCLKVVMTQAFERLPQASVSDYMTTDIVTLAPRATVFDVVDRFLKTAFRRLPVVDDDNNLRGVVSRTSVVKAIASLRDRARLHGTQESVPPETEAPGVDSAMRHARGK